MATHLYLTGDTIISVVTDITTTKIVNDVLVKHLGFGLILTNRYQKGMSHHNMFQWQVNSNI